MSLTAALRNLPSSSSDTHAPAPAPPPGPGARPDSAFTRRAKFVLTITGFKFRKQITAAEARDLGAPESLSGWDTSFHSQAFWLYKDDVLIGAIWRTA